MQCVCVEGSAGERERERKRKREVWKECVCV